MTGMKYCLVAVICLPHQFALLMKYVAVVQIQGFQYVKKMDQKQISDAFAANECRSMLLMSSGNSMI